MALSETEKLLATALRHHQAGRLPEAEALYRRIVAADPNHVRALQLLGVLAHQVGKNDAAIELIGKAIALNNRIPECHFYIGVVFQALGRLEEAATHFSKAMALKSDFVEACYELANVLARQEKLGEAEAKYRRALALRPDFIEALTNLGNVLMKQGRRDDAMARWREVLALQPHYPIALMNIGIALKQQGRLAEAMGHLRQVLSLKPDYAEAHYNLGAVLQALDRPDEAGAAYHRALIHRPDFPEAREALVSLLLTEGKMRDALDIAQRAFATRDTFATRSLLVACLRSSLLLPGLGDYRHLLCRALTESWARAADLAPTSCRFLVLNDAIGLGIARAAAAWPSRVPAENLVGADGLAAIAEDQLLRALLETTPVCDFGLEQFLTGVRFHLLAAARTMTGVVSEPILGFYSALARQCFINSYVFSRSPCETAWLYGLRDRLVAALASGAPLPALTVMAVASYIPLHALQGAEALLERQWPEPVAAIVVQQVREPLDERRSRASMPVLTTIDNNVSVQVRGQYEEHPYPQWVKVPSRSESESLNAFMGRAFPLSRFVETGHTGALDVLIAGCGTGQQAIEIALQFKNAEVLAVDLSLTSLCYARRQTRALGLHSLHYAQADILELPSINRTFDMIVTSGVLHHLADPLAGWRALASMLRPGGVMFVGLYSEIGRQNIVAARTFIAERGYRPSVDDIRRCRQELFASSDPRLRAVTTVSDFFSTNECRDLLFHVQEHRLSVPEIAAFIDDNNLEFLGFVVDPSTRRNYTREFPDDAGALNLPQWHRYELAHPGTFIGMYQFWVQKREAR